MSENGHHAEHQRDASEFWERPMEGEPHTAFMAFCAYRDQGIVRSLRSAAAEFYEAQMEPDDYRRATTELPTGAQLTRFKEWSRTWMWVARAEAYDMEESRKRSLQIQQDRVDAYADNMKIVRLGLNVSAQTLWACYRGEAFYPPGALPSLINSITTLSRLSMGEATSIEETRAKDPDAGPQIPDLSKLSDAEVDTLYELMEKLNSGD